ncbi:MAG: hypothetical protein AB7I38_17065 [Dehalococcoidia bacterium]
MAGTVTVSEEPYGSVKKVSFAWTSDASGNADAQTSLAYNGEVVRLVTDPDGTAAPTDNYDVAVNDEDGADVLMGAGANRDTANTEQVLASSLGVVANDKLTLQVTNAGNAKSGVVRIYIR